MAIYKNLAQMPAINWLDISLEVAERSSMLGAQTSLRGADTIVLQVAEQYGIPLLTKDKEIKRKSPKGIIVLDPTEISL